VTEAISPSLKERQRQPLLQHVRDLGPQTQIALWVLFLGCAAALLWGWISQTYVALNTDIHFNWVIVALLYFASERFVIDLDVREQTHSFSLSEIALVLSLIFAPPVDLLVGQLIGGGAALLFRPGQRPIKLLFNLANFAVCSGVALVVFRLVLGANDPLSLYGWMGAFAAALSADIVAAASVALVIWMSQRERPNLTSLFGVGTIYSAVAPSIALLAATVMVKAPSASWLLVALAAMTFVVLRLHGQQLQRHRSLSRLHESTRRVQQSFSLDEVAHSLLETSREMFEAEIAELMLFFEHDGRAQTLRLDDDGMGVWEDHQLDPLEGVWARVAAEGRGLIVRETSGSGITRARLEDIVRGLFGRSNATPERVMQHFRARGIRAAMIAPLRVEDAVVGTLLTGNRRGSVSEWSNSDVTLLETLANHAGVALQNSRQADELANQRDELARKSTHDDLTGLPNRRQFNDDLAAALATRNTGAVLVLDLDRFKEVNDTLGHHNGDRLLQDAADRLVAAMPPDVVVARLGGDEFAILVAHGEIDDAVATANAVIAALHAPFVVHGVTVQVEASIGICFFPAQGSDAATVMRRADVAMYAAKQSHSGYTVYEQHKDPYSEARLALLGELRKAIERGELNVHYQPQANPRTSRIEGVEALVRWHHPQRGDLSPDEFVTLAERSEVIHSLTRFVLRTAIAQAAEWHGQGFPVRMSVNLSARSLHDQSLADDIATMLSSSNLAPEFLELEITETSIESDPVRSDALLTHLHEMGIAVAIDDFGTGYSAFSYLQRLPIDEIKIDKSFVIGMESDQRQAAIVRSTIQLARNLGIRIVAEGVESASVQRTLGRLGCDLIQGYHVSRAVSPDILGGLLRRGSRETTKIAQPRRRASDKIVEISRSA
jgi:diguanylate cyclase (GGDEF)-like protein